MHLTALGRGYACFSEQSIALVFEGDLARTGRQVIWSVSAPGCTTYYLWALAGNQRIQATVDDPPLAWVGRAVPMLKALGH